jgi:hypothetical protein
MEQTKTSEAVHGQLVGGTAGFLTEITCREVSGDIYGLINGSGSTGDEVWFLWVLCLEWLVLLMVPGVPGSGGIKYHVTVS